MYCFSSYPVYYLLLIAPKVHQPFLQKVLSTLLPTAITQSMDEEQEIPAQLVADALKPNLIIVDESFEQAGRLHISRLISANDQLCETPLITLSQSRRELTETENDLFVPVNFLRDKPQQISERIRSCWRMAINARSAAAGIFPGVLTQF